MIFNYPKAFNEYSNDVHDVYRNIGKYNLNKKTQDIIPELSAALFRELDKNTLI